MSAPADWSHGPALDRAVPAPPPALADILRRAAARRASDVLLVAGAPPTVFEAGRWVALDSGPLPSGQIDQLIRPILTPAQAARFDAEHDVDLGLTVESVRYRVNVHRQRGTTAAAFRAIPGEIPHVGELNLPESITRVVEFPSGLVLITGGTGQGKSTTLAALIGYLNHTRSAHVVTIEDPVEYVFSHGSCVIEQRELGADTPSFAAALRHVVRQRPDVIVIGEMRDLETISTALTAAETGHLVIASLHTNSAAQTLSRIVDVFPAPQQPQVRTQLAGSLRAVVCQALVRNRAGDGLVPAVELLFADSAVRRAVRENDMHLIYSMIETGRERGMQTLEQSLADLLRRGVVAPEDAHAAACVPSQLERLAGPAATGTDRAPASRPLKPGEPLAAAGSARA